MDSWRLRGRFRHQVSSATNNTLCYQGGISIYPGKTHGDHLLQVVSALFDADLAGLCHPCIHRGSAQPVFSNRKEVLSGAFIPKRKRSTFTRQTGSCDLICRVASKPSMPGISTSIRITSGRSDPALATASLPSPAKPTTRMAGRFFLAAPPAGSHARSEEPVPAVSEE